MEKPLFSKFKKPLILKRGKSGIFKISKTVIFNRIQFQLRIVSISTATSQHYENYEISKEYKAV
jgi:hypothetical protein